MRIGGPSILVWGAILEDGSRALIRCEGSLDAKKYQDVLQEGLQNFDLATSVFMQDGARCHTAASTINYLEKKHVMLLSDWPPQSPDINIIENLWYILKKNVSCRHITDANNLWTVAKDEWDQISDNIIKKLYKSIPTRLKAIRTSKGFPIKY